MEISKELQPGGNQEITAKLLENTKSLQGKVQTGSRLTRASTGTTPSRSTAKPLLPRRKKSGKPKTASNPSPPIRANLVADNSSAASKQGTDTTSLPAAPAAPPTDLAIVVNQAQVAQLILAQPERGRSLPREMSVNRRGPRGGGRGGVQESGEEVGIWRDIQQEIAKLDTYERRAAELKKQIFAKEVKMKDAKVAGKEPSLEDYNELDAMYREQVRIAESQKALIGSLSGQTGLLQTIDVLTGLVRHNENENEMAMPRGSGSRDSRSTVDMDGPSDSPGPSPADTRRFGNVKGQGRTSSQPPRSSGAEVVVTTGTPSEPSERNTAKPKVVYAVNDEVAFKRKSGEETDWIQGQVTRVIGEGKSRRYEVKDPYPDDKSVDNVYKSSASQMVPIPKDGTKLEDYEPGKRVLALYPSTSTFYRADVMRMLEGGSKVELLFEDETEGKLQQVERRFVLDHKG